jgi:hypothetical protein
MANSSPYQDTDADTRGAPDRGPQAGTPRWVKVFGILAGAAFLVFLIIVATAGSQMGGGGR